MSWSGIAKHAFGYLVGGWNDTRLDKKYVVQTQMRTMRTWDCVQ